jgi:hypothetical protein
MPRREPPKPEVEVRTETKRVTRIDYNALALDELIRDAVLARCNIKPGDNVNVIVSLYGDENGENISGHATIEEVLDA